MTGAEMGRRGGNGYDKGRPRRRRVGIGLVLHGGGHVKVSGVECKSCSSKGVAMIGDLWLCRR